MSIRLTNHMERALVLAGFEAPDVTALIDAVVDQVVAAHPEVDVEALRQRLLDRERVSSTCLGRGIAIPHATVPGLTEPLCVVARPKEAVRFSSEPDGLVSVVFVLLSPPTGMCMHVKLLARVARLCSLKGFVARLNEAEDAEALRRLLAEEDGRHV